MDDADDGLLLEVDEGVEDFSLVVTDGEENALNVVGSSDLYNLPPLHHLAPQEWEWYH